MDADRPTVPLNGRFDPPWRADDAAGVLTQLGGGFLLVSGAIVQRPDPQLGREQLRRGGGVAALVRSLRDFFLPPSSAGHCGQWLLLLSSLFLCSCSFLLPLLPFSSSDRLPTKEKGKM